MTPSAPSTDDLTCLSSRDLTDGYRTHRFRPSEVTDAVLARILATGDKYNAFITLSEEHARRHAADLDRLMMAEPDRIGPGFGVPITIKDITATAGIRTTRGAARTAEWVPDFDAEAVARLRRAGAIVLGKTNTSEAAWKAEGSNPTFGSSLNPWAPTMTPGGSSGGAGVATAMRYGTWATGTDGFGSIRVPASFCHVVGFKPTLGSVPYYPVSTEFLSHIGPLARTVGDARDAYQIMCGPHRRDPLATTTPTPAISKTHMTIGAIDEVDSDHVDPFIHAAFDQFAAWFDDQGHRTRSIQLPAGGADIVGTIISAFTATELDGETDTQLARRDPDLVALAQAARKLSAVDLATAQSRRIDYFHAVEDLFDTVDYVISPTVSRLPFPAGQHSPPPYHRQVTHWHRWCSMTYPWNIAGNPAVSIPWTRTVDGLPVGMQIIGRHGDDLGVLALAETLEQQRPWAGEYALL